MIQNGMEIDFIQMGKRPDKVRVEGTFQALTFIQTYNGKEGWNLNPFTGATDPQPMSEDEIKSMKYQADMDGMLWNWSLFSFLFVHTIFLPEPECRISREMQNLPG